MYIIVTFQSDTTNEVKVVRKENSDIMKFNTKESAESFAKINLESNWQIVKLHGIGD